MQSKNTSWILNIMLGIMVLIIIFLGYVLWKKQSDNIIATPQGINTPVMPVKQKITVFTDGLGQPNSSTEIQPDETGAGITKIDVFEFDLNNDGITDRITRSKHETGTSHAWQEYTIELKRDNNTWNNITPDGFRTTEGAECSLQKLQFIFEPKFHVIKISRPWESTWDTPTVAKKTVYIIQDNKIVPNETLNAGTVCDVKDLFIEK